MDNIEYNTGITIDWVISHLKTNRWKDEDKEKARRLIHLLVEQEVCRARIIVLEDSIKRFDKMNARNT